MKKKILFLLVLSLVFSCATKKPEKRSNFLKGFYTKYNTLFNAEEAMGYEFNQRSTAFQENFYSEYIPLLTYENAIVGGDLANSSAFGTNSVSSPSSMAESGRSQNPRTGRVSSGPTNPNEITEPSKNVTPLEITEAKALKAIDKYSVLREGQEKNDRIFEAYMLLAQSRIYMGKSLRALDALNQVFNKMKTDKRLPLAKVYQGLAYSKMGDYVKANQIFAELNKQDLDKDFQKPLSIYYSESLLKANQKDASLKELEKAFEVNGNRELKSRIAYLRGQILSSQGKNELARESFTTAYKYANDFEFEVKSQIEIAKTFNGKSDYEGGKDYIEKISKKGTYATRKNEFYYALGLMANKAGKKEEAMQYFRKSLEEKVSDPQIRGLNYFEIGKSYLEGSDYISAGAYYDSALAVMTYEPAKIELQTQSEYIKKISKNYYLVKKNDSILALAKMTKPQQEEYFSKYIKTLKNKEEALERERIRAERSKGFDTGDYNTNSVFANNGAAFQDFGGGTKGFYFSNNNSVSRGSAEFKQIWGSRSLSDNWRYSASMATIEDEKNQALGLTSAPNPRRFETDFYIEKIPKNPAQLENLKKDRDTASLGLGIMYEDYFSNTPLATTTLYDLVDNKPEEKIMLRALYEIFSMNYEKNPSAAARAKQILISDYPYTSYAEFARNPRSNSFIKSNPQAELAYKQAFALYEGERFQESSKLIDETVKQFPNDALIPKFALLNAFNSGKMNGKEVMILQLEQVALNYDETLEGEKAKEMLKYLKSDLSLQMRDEKGNAVGGNNQKISQPIDNETQPFGVNSPNNIPTKEQQQKAEKQQQKNQSLKKQQLEEQKLEVLQAEENKKKGK